MTRAQIDILIKDQDIWLESSAKYSHAVKASFIDYDNEKTFVVSDELYSIIERIFEYQLSFERDFDHDTFKTLLTNKLKFISPLKEQKLLFYHQQLSEQNNQLSEILSGKFYNIIPELILSAFHLLFYENGMNWIECIKFKMLKGEKLAAFNFGKLGEARTPNYYLITEFFKSESMMQIYEIATIAENINYLQKMINKIDKSQDNKPTHRQKAVAYIINQWANETKFPPLARHEAKKIDVSFYDALDDLAYFPEKTKGSEKVRKEPYRKMVLKDLQAVEKFKLLSDPAALKLLEIEIDRRKVK